MAFLGDALAHAILPGVAIAYLLGANLLLGALVAAVLVAVGIGLFSRRGGVKEDTAIGILFAAALALGVAAHEHGAVLRHRPHAHPVRQRARASAPATCGSPASSR